MSIRVGEIVKSVTGHDKGEIFVVVRMDKEYVYICNGKRRKADNPKKKKIKHIIGLGLTVEWIEDFPERVNNTSIRKAIKDLITVNG